MVSGTLVGAMMPGAHALSAQSPDPDLWPVRGIVDEHGPGTPLQTDGPGTLPGMLLQAELPGATRQAGLPGAHDRAFIASALLPGSGQWILGQRRWVLYLLVEGAGWLEYSRRRSDGSTLRRAYRDLAWERAREPITGGQRIDGGFEYYETMTHFPASGVFDRAPSEPGVRPETDPSTYNGMIWALARDLFLPPGDAEPDEESEAYARALAYYQERSFGSDFEWDWQGQDAERTRFARLIRDSDDAFRRSTTMLGVVIGNHLLSSIDALVSSRIPPLAASGMRLEFRLVPLHAGIRRGGAARGPSALLTGLQRDPWALQATLFH